jgi:hypothetical protein
MTLAKLINNAQLSTLVSCAAQYTTHDDLTRWVKDLFKELGVEDTNNCWSEQLYDLQLSQNPNEAAMSRILDAAGKQWQKLSSQE